MDLQSIIENGSASVTIQITAKDLKDFATHLFEAAVRKAKAEQASADGEEYLSKAEVMELFGVCDTTLWHWAKFQLSQTCKSRAEDSLPETGCHADSKRKGDVIRR